MQIMQLTFDFMMFFANTYLFMGFTAIFYLHGLFIIILSTILVELAIMHLGCPNGDILPSVTVKNDAFDF